MDLNELSNLLIEHKIATVDEIRLVICINGFSEETLNSILCAKTGYSNFNHYLSSVTSN